MKKHSYWTWLFICLFSRHHFGPRRLMTQIIEISSDVFPTQTITLA